MKIHFLFKCLLFSALVGLFSFISFKGNAQSLRPMNGVTAYSQAVKNTTINGNTGYLIPQLAPINAGFSSSNGFSIVAMAVDSFMSNGDSIAVPLSAAVWTIEPALGIQNFFNFTRYQYWCMLGWLPASGLSTNGGGYLPIYFGQVLFICANPNRYGNIYYWRN